MEVAVVVVVFLWPVYVVGSSTCMAILYVNEIIKMSSVARKR